MPKSIFVLGFFFQFCINTYSQNFFFEKKIGGEFPEYSRGILQYENGDIFMIGFAYFHGNDAQCILTKTNLYGELLWTKQYGGIYNDFGGSITLNHDNNLIIVYETQKQKGDLDIAVLKLDTSGNIMLHQSVASSLNESPRKIISTKDSCSIIVGFQADGFNSNNIYIVKLDSTLMPIWDLSIGGTDNDYATGIIELSDTSYVVSSDSRSFSDGGYDIYLLKFDRNGNVIWDRNFGNDLDNGSQGLISTTEGNVFVYGETYVDFRPHFDFYTLLIDTSGIEIWQYDIGGNGSDAAFSAVQSNDGNFILTGYSNSNNPQNPIDLVVCKVNSTGQIIWENFFGDEGIDIGYEILKSQSEGLLITGHSYTSDNDFQKYLLHLSNLGNLYVDENLLLQQNYLVYPNPFNSFVTVNELKGGEIIEMYSLEGQKINIDVLGNKVKISNNISPGIYFLKIIKNQNVQILKIVKG